MLLCGRPQIRDRDLGRGKLDRMANIPLLELARIGLDMELKRKRVATVGREHGTAAIENFTEPKAVWMNLNV